MEPGHCRCKAASWKLKIISGSLATLRSKKADGVELQWVRRAGSTNAAPDGPFEVREVLPAAAPDMDGIRDYVYKTGIYVEECGVQKALFLHLEKKQDSWARGSRSNPAQLHLFACKTVSERMRQAYSAGRPVGQNFMPQRGRRGWAIRGGRPFEVSAAGWVWQEPNNGCITFYYVDEEQNAQYTFKQWTDDGWVWYWHNGKFHAIKAPRGKWQHEDVNEWAKQALEAFHAGGTQEGTESADRNQWRGGADAQQWQQWQGERGWQGNQGEAW